MDHKLHWRHLRIGIVILSLVFVGTFPVQKIDATVRTTAWAPKDPPSIYDVNAGPNAVRRYDPQNDVCTSDTQLDCLESVEAFINNAWVPGVRTGRTGFDNTTEWKIAGLVNEDGRDLVEVSNAIAYTGNIFHQINIYVTSIDNFRPAWESGRMTSTCAKVNDICVRYGQLQENIPFRVTYRSSWVLPTALSAKLTDTTTTVEKLATSGATRVTVQGTPLLYQGVADQADVTNPNGVGAWLSREFSVGMVDGRFYPVKKECIEKPTMTIAENGYGSPLPEFKNGQLDLKVSAPHFRPNGTDKHLGIYEAFIPLETAQCLWGATIATDSVFAVNVLNPDNGALKNSTPSFQFSNSGFLISARDYTYSTPTIRVAPLPRPKKPTKVTVSASRKTISASFSRVKGVNYSVTASKGAATKKLKCKSTKTRVSCSLKNVEKGTWTVSVIAIKDKVQSIPYTKRVRMK